MPIVGYIDCDTLRKILMKETPMCIPEIVCRVREKIHKYENDSMCLIFGNYNPADEQLRKNQIQY